MATNFPLMSSQIFSSREAIRDQLCTYSKEYLDLASVDLTKSSFLSFIINVMSSLTSNLIFYNSSVYREFFLTQAQLPESVFDLASFIGYSPLKASAATANLLFTIPLTFTNDDVSINIPEGFIFHAGDVPFSTYYNTNIRIIGNSSVTVTINSESQIYNIPVNMNYSDSTSIAESFSFVAPVKQSISLVQQFQIDQDIQKYQFINVNVPFQGQASSIKVEITEPESAAPVIYDDATSLYLMTNMDQGYVAKLTDDGMILYFGNGLIGYQPKPGSTVQVTIEQTLGSAGNVISGSISQGDRIYANSVDNAGNPVTQVLNYTVINTSPATGGQNQETIDEVRVNAINNLASRNRLVSESDYVNINVVIPDTPILQTSLPILKRSDLKVNEIVLFLVLQYLGEPIKTRNLYYDFPLGSTLIPKGTVLTDTDGTNYYSIFDMELNINLSSSQRSSLTDYYYIYTGEEQSVIPTGVNYLVGSNNLEVYLNGKLLNRQASYNGITYGQYIETSANTITLNSNITPNVDDKFRFRLVTPTSDDFLHILSAEEIIALSFSLPSFSSSLIADLRIFKNNLYLNEEIDGVGDYVYNRETNQIEFNIGLSLGLNDEIRIIGDDQLTTKQQYVITDTNLLTGLVEIVDDYTSNYNVLEVYKNGLLLNKMQILSNGTLYGSYYEVSTTHIQFTDGSISLNDLVSYRITQELPELSYLSNDIGYYTYVVSNIVLNPILKQTYGNINNVILNKIEIDREVNIVGQYTPNINVTASFFSNGTDTSGVTCVMSVVESSQTFDMTQVGDTFHYTIDYTKIPQNSITLNFTIKDEFGNYLVTYYTTLVIWQKLDMQSNVVVDSTGITAYDIPVIDKTYYDAIKNKKDFEGLVFQDLFNKMDFYDYRMLTDFVNIKFANATGPTRNMLYNKTTRSPVISIENGIPSTPISGGRYIIRDSFDSTSSIYVNKIIEWGGSEWASEDPQLNDTVYISTLQTIAIFTGTKWVIPDYTIPLELDLEIAVSPSYSGDLVGLVADIKKAIMNYYSPKFGVNIPVYRSEIIRLTQEIQGVSYCSLNKPESDIFFKFNIDDFTQDQLLKYGPDYIYFTEDNISVKVVY